MDCSTTVHVLRPQSCTAKLSRRGSSLGSGCKKLYEAEMAGTCCHVKWGLTFGVGLRDKGRLKLDHPLHSSLVDKSDCNVESRVLLRSQTESDPVWRAVTFHDTC
ncbi:hypothetical protein AAC387_Pa06g2163 [Persea americana]